MEFDQLELSTQDGTPVRLYEAERQGLFYRYTNSVTPITVDGALYVPVAIKDSGLVKSGQADNDTVSITLPSNTPLALLYNAIPPSDGVAMRIRKVHREPATGEVSNAHIIWVGTVSGYRRLQGDKALTLLCDTLSITFSRGGLRLVWGTGCPHMLYDDECGVNRDTYKVDVMNIEIVDGRRVACPEIGDKPAGWFDGGIIEWENEDGTTEGRGLELTVGDVAMIFGTTIGMRAGPARLYPGCRRTMEVCNSKFNNHENYGGFDDLPGRSPFDGNPVF